jgi:hypothetical protein
VILADHLVQGLRAQAVGERARRALLQACCAEEISH